MTKTVEIKNTSSVPLNGVKPGAIISIAVDNDGVPTDRYWRNRLRDAGKDSCVEIVKQAEATGKKDTK